MLVTHTANPFDVLMAETESATESTEPAQSDIEFEIITPETLKRPYFELELSNLTPEAIASASTALRNKLHTEYTTYLDAYAMEFRFDDMRSSLKVSMRVSPQAWYNTVQFDENFDEIWKNYRTYCLNLNLNNHGRVTEPIPGKLVPVGSGDKFTCEEVVKLCDGSSRICGFPVYDGSLISVNKNDKMHVGVQSELVRRITVSPKKHMTNDELICSADWWKSIVDTLKKYGANAVQVNFGAWENNLSKFNNQATCHGHFHLDFDVNGWTQLCSNTSLDLKTRKWLGLCMKTPTNYALKDFLDLQSLHRREFLLESIYNKLK
jgi:hypothetical protein